MSSTMIMIVTFPMKTEIPSIRSNVKREHWEEVLSGFLACQVGAGADATPPRKRAVYTIQIDLDLDDDVYYNKHDCGNKGLRDGLLMATLQKIRDGVAREES